MLSVGETAPGFRAQPVFGLPVDVEKHTARYPLVICFVSSLGSPLTRQSLADLLERVDHGQIDPYHAAQQALADRALLHGWLDAIEDEPSP